MNYINSNHLHLDDGDLSYILTKDQVYHYFEDRNFAIGDFEGSITISERTHDNLLCVISEIKPSDDLTQIDLDYCSVHWIYDPISEVYQIEHMSK